MHSFSMTLAKDSYISIARKISVPRVSMGLDLRSELGAQQLGCLYLSGVKLGVLSNVLESRESSELGSGVSVEAPYNILSRRQSFTLTTIY